MNSSTIAKCTSCFGLMLILASSGLALTGTLSSDAVKASALIGTILWFVAAAIWIGRDTQADAR